MKFIKKHKVGLIILVVVIAAITGLFFWLKSVGEKTLEALTAATVETAVAEERSLVSVVSATGKIVSLQSKDVNSTATGVKVMDVLVDIGDEVKAGDIIAILDSSDFEDNLSNVETSIENTKKTNSLSLNSAQRSYNETVTSGAINLQRQYDNIIDAQKELDDTKALRDQFEGIYDREAEAWNKAELEYEAVLATVSGNDTPPATQEALRLARSKADKAKSATEAALSNYQSYITKVATLESSFEKLRQTYEDTERSVQSSMAATQDQITSAKISSSNNTTSLEQQKSAYEDKIEACTITAPFDGVITAMKVEKGDTYAGTPICTIEDVSSYEITTEIDEYDIGKIKKGQRVVIKTNGTGDEELEGTVKTVAPRASMGNAVTYKVTISVDTPNDMLRLDMTAKLSIILEESKKTVTVPYDAVKTDDDGNKYVELVDGTDDTGALITHTVYVTTGIETDYYIEIISGDIKAGDEVKIVREASTTFNLNDFLIEEGAMGGM